MANSILKLNSREQRVFNALEAQNAALGTEIPIKFLTQILAEPSRQKFTQVKLSDYCKIDIGTGAWAPAVLKPLVVASAGDWDSGVIDTGSDGARMAQVTSGIGTMTFPIIPWGKRMSWSIPELKKYALMNLEPIVERKWALEKDWQTGLQDKFFCGSTKYNLAGLLTNSQVHTDTSVLGANTNFGDLYDAAFQTAVVKMMTLFDNVSNRTAVPDRFVVPLSDYRKMASFTSSTYQNYTKLQYLTNMFKDQTGNPDFKILGSPYADAGFGSLAKNRYALYNSQPDSMVFGIPVDLTFTLYNSLDNFWFNSIGYGEISGMQMYYPNQCIYFESTAS